MTTTASSDIAIAGDPLGYPGLAALLRAQPHLSGQRPDAGPTVSELARRAGVIAADPGVWSGLIRHDPDQARPWRTRLAQAADHEVWLLSWLPGQLSGLHAHDGHGGVFAVAAGQLTERYEPALAARRPAAGLARRTLDAGQSRVFGPCYRHELANEGPVPAVSVHVSATRPEAVAARPLARLGAAQAALALRD